MFTFPHSLYPIVDTLGDPQLSHLGLARSMLAAGVRFLQLRVKDVPTRGFIELATAIQKLAAEAGASLIINDRADIAKLVQAAGVHLGQEDLPAAQARAILGPDAIIGFSTHNAEQAEAAVRQGVVDYIGFGPIFPTSSKLRPDPVQGLVGVREVRRRVALPIVAIGGITTATLPDVLAAGADAAAMISEIVRAPDVGEAVARLLRVRSAGI